MIEMCLVVDSGMDLEMLSKIFWANGIKNSNVSIYLKDGQCFYEVRFSVPNKLLGGSNERSRKSLPGNSKRQRTKR